MLFTSYNVEFFSKFLNFLFKFLQILQHRLQHRQSPSALHFEFPFPLSRYIPKGKYLKSDQYFSI